VILGRVRGRSRTRLAGGPAEISAPAGAAGVWRYDATKVALNGATISSALDHIGSQHVAQGTPGAQPTWVANALNGRGVARFDGGDYLSIGSFTLGANSGFTLVSVGKITTANAFGLFLGYIDTGNELRQGNSTGRANVRNGPNAQVNSLQVDTGSFKLFVATFDGGTGVLELFVNGVSQGTAVGAYAVPTSGALAIGARPSGTLPLIGDQAENRIYPRPWVAADHAQMRAYVNDYYALGI
jgi:hypothetical protein